MIGLSINIITNPSIEKSKSIIIIVRIAILVKGYRIKPPASNSLAITHTIVNTTNSLDPRTNLEATIILDGFFRRFQWGRGMGFMQLNFIIGRP